MRKSKNARGYPDRVEVFCVPGTRTQLLAIAYLMGARGEMSTPLRNFIAHGIRDYIANLKGQDLKDYQEILANVQLAENQKSPAL